MLTFPPHLRLLSLALCLSAVVPLRGLATSDTVSNSIQQSSGFEDGTISPFSVCTTQKPAYVVPAVYQGRKCLKHFWTQVGYDGTRMDRGAEACSPFQTFKEGWYGFLFYLPSPGYPKDKEGAIAQIFQDGSCSSWAALLIVRQGALYLNYRANCSTPTQALITDAVQYNAWTPVLIHFIASHQKAATIEVWYGGAVATPASPTYRATGTNFGFGVWNTDDTLATGNALGLKIGMYNYDSGNYTVGETRTIYYDNICQLFGNPANAFAIASPLDPPAPTTFPLTPTTPTTPSTPTTPTPPAPPTTPTAPPTPVPGVSAKGRFTNLSVRSRAGIGEQTLIAGFIISGAGTKPVLVRGSGPTLANFGVSGVLMDPRLDLHLNSTVVAQNDSWKSAINQTAIAAAGGDKLGPFLLDSKEAIIATELTAAAYTALVTGADGGSGIALVEVDDTDNTTPGTSGFDLQPRLINISARSQVGSGEGVLIAGFTINGTAPKRVMIRASGSTLANFGVKGVLANPVLKLYRASAVIAENAGWRTATNTPEILSVNGDKLGSFALDGRDSIILMTLLPGAYTAIVSGLNDSSGVALVEIFDQD